MLQSDLDDHDLEDVEEKAEADLPCPNAVHQKELSTYSREDLESEEHISAPDHPHDNRKEPPPTKSLELARTASNVLKGVLTTKPLIDPGPPPDGGIQAWTQVACGWLAILVTWGWVNSYGAFQTYYTLHLNESVSTISWIGTMQNWFTFFVGAFSGRLLDAGYFRAVFLAGSIIQIAGIFLMSISTEFWQLMLTQGVMTGLGGGLFFVPAMGLISTYFSHHRSLAIGLATTGNAVGGMIYPVMVKELLPKLGFAWTTRVLGFFNLALLATAITFMRPRLPPRKSGPIVDWAAFKDPPFAFYYRLVRRPRTAHGLLAVHDARDPHQRRRRPRARDPAVLRRWRRPAEHHGAGAGRPRRPDLHLARRHDARRPLRLHRLLRPTERQLPVPVAQRLRQPHPRSQHGWHAAGHDVQLVELRGADGPADRGCIAERGRRAVLGRDALGGDEYSDRSGICDRGTSGKSGMESQDDIAVTIGWPKMALTLRLNETWKPRFGRTACSHYMSPGDCYIYPPKEAAQGFPLQCRQGRYLSLVKRHFILSPTMQPAIDVEI
nr:aspyridones efflux protein apdf [Quercus suber]